MKASYKVHLGSVEIEDIKVKDIVIEYDHETTALEFLASLRFTKWFTKRLPEIMKDITKAVL